MIVVAGHIAVEPRQRESYLTGCMGIVEQAREKADCLDFAITADLIDPDRIAISERWESQVALEAHRSGGGPSDAQGAAMRAASVADYDITYVRLFFEKGTA